MSHATLRQSIAVNNPDLQGRDAIEIGNSPNGPTVLPEQQIERLATSLPNEDTGRPNWLRRHVTTLALGALAVGIGVSIGLSARSDSLSLERIEHKVIEVAPWAGAGL